MDSSHSVNTIFFGTSSVYITDGTSSIFIDAFLSRPSLFQVAFGKLRSDSSLIKETLRHANISRCDAIFIAHSHYDHVLDAPEVAKLLGSRIYGSKSTLNLIRENDVYSFGDFKVRIFEGLHSPGNNYPGTIDEPLALPRKARDMKDGGCYSFYITHLEGCMLIHPSANFVPGKFTDVDVDVLYLGIGMLGAQPRDFQENYWMHTVEATRPRLLVPIHWDNFFKPLSDILQPMPAFLDHFTASKTFIDRKVGESGLKVLWQGPLETIAIFDTNNAAERDEASKRVKLWETNRSLFAWFGSFFNARQVVIFGCIGLLCTLYKTHKV